MDRAGYVFVARQLSRKECKAVMKQILSVISLMLVVALGASCTQVPTETTEVIVYKSVTYYVIEGHVPAQDIKRLLAQKPAVAGLAVPGMPAGSPGMEGPRKDPYNVYTFDKAGRTTVYARY
jgi:hypothetical protein